METTNPILKLFKIILFLLPTNTQDYSQNKNRMIRAIPIKINMD